VTNENSPPSGGRQGRLEVVWVHRLCGLLGLADSPATLIFGWSPIFPRPAEFDRSHEFVGIYIKFNLPDGYQDLFGVIRSDQVEKFAGYIQSIFEGPGRV
jgi:hypothetical protein